MSERHLFPLVMACLMALMMSGLLTAIFFGVHEGFIARWLHTFLFAWPCASGAVFIALPLAHRITPALLKLTGGRRDIPLNSPPQASVLVQGCSLWQKAHPWLVARLLMAAMFVESAVDKMLHWEHYLNETMQMGIPLAPVALLGAVATELFGSFALVSGKALRTGAALLALYVLVLGFFYFDFWAQTGQAAVMARKEFLKDLAVIGGLLLCMLPDLQRNR